MRCLAGSALLLLIAGCAASPRDVAAEQQRHAATADKLQAALAGFSPGTPTSCLPLSYPDVQTTAYGATILYRVSSNLVYRNDTSGGCESMEHGDYIVTVSNEGRTCQGDIGRTFQPSVGIPTGSCALGRFVPYTRHG
jgi:hypothetical protein